MNYEFHVKKTWRILRFHCLKAMEIRIFWKDSIYLYSKMKLTWSPRYWINNWCVFAFSLGRRRVSYGLMSKSAVSSTIFSYFSILKYAFSNYSIFNKSGVSPLPFFQACPPLPELCRVALCIIHEPMQDINFICLWSTSFTDRNVFLRSN